MLDQLTSSQLAEWQAYDKLEQIGEYRRDFRIAQLTAIFYNFASSFASKGKRVAAKPQDFMPWLDQKMVETKKEQSVEEMKQELTSIVKVHNKDKDKKKKPLIKKFPFKKRK